MVSDKPPRRSKSDKSPVTIDLAAEDVSTIATPVRSDDSDAPIAAANTDATASDAAETGKPAAATKPADMKPEATSPPAGMAKTTTATEAAQTVTSGGQGASAPAPTSTSASTPTHTATASAASSATGSDTANSGATGASTTTAAPKTFGTNTAGATGTTDASSTKPDPRPKQTDSRTAGSSASSSGEPARQSPATSSLIAAGIFGGIVALALAGSMFYAGVIPAAGNGNASETAALQQQIDRLNQQLASSTAAIDALKTTATGDAGAADSTAISERLAALEARMGEAGSNTAAAEALTQRLAALEAKVDQPGREEAVAKALAASALKTAIDRGGPFTGELQTFSGIAGNDPAVSVLEKFAATGVPSASDLLQKFPQTAQAILNAAHQTDEQAGVGSRLLSSAMQMVKVRPVGNVEGDTPEAVVARMEDQLRKGNLKGASSEWDTLPQPAKDASVAYKQTLDARIEVDGLVDNTLNRAISGASNAG